MAKKPTLSDVAKLAGVSSTTVSLVLNNKADGIPDETKQRVSEAISALRYRHNTLAANLRRQTSDTIGFISDEIATTPHAGAMVQGAQDEAWKADKLLVLINTGRDREIETHAVEALLSRQVAGIVYSAMYHQIVSIPESVLEVPVVILDGRSEDGSVTWVAPDEFGGGFAATERLLMAGHRRIGFVESAESIPASVERLAGYRAALEAHAITFDPELVAQGESEASGGYSAAARLLELDPRPTGLFCFNDRMAGGAVRKALQLGLSIPDDLSIIGFDNQELVISQIDPPLTTVQLPHYEMGRWAVQHLLSEIGGGDREVVQHRMPCPLVERQSVAPPRATP